MVLERNGFHRKPLLAWVFLGLGALATLAATTFVARYQVQRTTSRFETEASEAAQALHQRLQAYEDVLWGVQALFRAHPHVDHQVFKEYLTSQAPEKRYPGILGLTFGFKVRQSELAGFEKQMRSELGPLPDGREFTIFPRIERDTHFIISYIHPEPLNVGVIGFDSGSTPGQSEAVEQTIRSGDVVATGPITLVQDPEQSPGLILRLAAYSPGMPLTSPSERWEAAIGYINAAFRLKDLAAQTLPLKSQRQIRVEIIDHGRERPAPQPNTGTTLFTAGSSAASLRPKRLYDFWLPELTTSRSLLVGGRNWQLRFQGGAGFAPLQDRLLPLAVLVLGLVLSGLLGGLLHSQLTLGMRAFQLAQQMADRLLASESRLSAVAEVTPDQLSIFDENGVLLELYSARLLGLPQAKEELIGRSVHEFFPPPVAQSVCQTISSALSSETPQTIEYDLPTPNGTCTFEAKVTRLEPDAAGRRTVVWICRDITERKLVEASQRQAQKLESLGLMAGGIAHDFNNLLTAILGNLNLAQHQLPAADAAHAALERAEKSVLRAADLTRQILAYSGQAPIVVKAFDLNQLVHEMANLLRVSMSKKIHLQMALSENVPAVRGDVAQIQQVVMNLVTNAADAIGDREGTIRITSGAMFLDREMIQATFLNHNMSPGLFVTLEVSDTGSGMTPEVMGRIFDPFFTTKVAGRGLGLSAMLGILKNHGAGVKIFSEPGIGSAFRLFLPGSKEEISEERTDHQVGADALRGTILVVDDEATIRESAGDSLKLLGLKVILAEDGQSGLEVFKEREDEIDAVLLDVAMPRMDGIQVFARLRETRPNIPVILSSGFSQFSAIEGLLKQPKVAFLAKPYVLSELRECLAAFLPVRESSPSGQGQAWKA